MKKYIAHQSEKSQKGLVLFFALIALVAMSLAAAALIRSVDTSVLVAGNLAFRQSATISADSGLVSASDWIVANSAALNNTSAANGYYATSADLSAVLPIGGLAAAEGATWTSGDAWTDTTSRLAVGNGLAAGADSAGNTIRYVVQRMCRTAGTATTASCLMGSTAAEGNSLGSTGEQGLGAGTNDALSPMYRVTARVAGPKNTVSYIQAYIF
ncbi:MAG: hypothetical protein ACKE5M_05520 [Methylophilaceae bacterium]